MVLVMSVKMLATKPFEASLNCDTNILHIEGHGMHSHLLAQYVYYVSGEVP